MKILISFFILFLGFSDLFSANKSNFDLGIRFGCNCNNLLYKIIINYPKSVLQNLPSPPQEAPNIKGKRIIKI